MRRKSISGSTERNSEPVTIYLEDFCEECCERSFGGGEYDDTARLKHKYQSWQKPPLKCLRCNDTRAVINSDGLAFIDFIAKYLK